MSESIDIRSSIQNVINLLQTPYYDDANEYKENITLLPLANDDQHNSLKQDLLVLQNNANETNKILKEIKDRILFDIANKNNAIEQLKQLLNTLNNQA
jgi:hypothetical protein